VVIGGTVMMFGQFLCALKQEPLLYVGGRLLIVGNGLFKANISTMVGQLYRPGDARRDAAFTIFYMGINLGAAVGPFLCGTSGREGGLVPRVRERRAGDGGRSADPSCSCVARMLPAQVGAPPRGNE
jgi:dipeptide/tripeptide permease